MPETSVKKMGVLHSAAWSDGLRFLIVGDKGNPLEASRVSLSKKEEGGEAVAGKKGFLSKAENAARKRYAGLCAKIGGG